jgi:cadmium resistance protein CadD (predicted permease)
MRKRSNSSFLGFVVVAAIALAALALALKLLPAAFHAFLWALGLIPLALTLAGLYSCLSSNKQTNTKILWVVVILLAPFLGPILWFAWGKRNT